MLCPYWRNAPVTEVPVTTVKVAELLVQGSVILAYLWCISASVLAIVSRRSCLDSSRFNPFSIAALLIRGWILRNAWPPSHDSPISLVLTRLLIIDIDESSKSSRSVFFIYYDLEPVSHIFRLTAPKTLLGLSQPLLVLGLLWISEALRGAFLRRPCKDREKDI